MLPADWERTIMVQYANSKKLLALSGSVNITVDPRQDIDRFYRDIMDLETCNEWGLYVWGVITAAPKSVALIDESIDFFGFQGSDFTPFFDAPFFNGRWGHGYSELSGEDYRRMIWFKAAVNIISTNIPDIEAAIQTFLDGRPEGEERVSVVVHEPSRMVIEAAIYDGALTQVERAILTEYGGMLSSSGVSFTITENNSEIPEPSEPQNIVEILWASWKKSYYDNGRVYRPNNESDTVSEGQAYGMLWAVWFDDPDTFDAIYEWTENNLSRYNFAGDHLLSWHWGKLGNDRWGIIDRMPAADADVDYILALIMASKIWPDRVPPVGLLSYANKAMEVAQSFMQKLVLDVPNGEKVVIPWIYNDREREYPIQVNPSYFSPGHFRAIGRFTQNAAWEELADDCYAQLCRILTLEEGETVVTVPDWINMDSDGSFSTRPERGYISSWEAFRVWWRIRLDYDAYADETARTLIVDRLAPFVRRGLDALNDELMAAENDKYGNPLYDWGNSGMDAVHWFALHGLGAEEAGTAKLKEVAMSRLLYSGNVYAYFQDRGDYYTNSWAWLAALNDDAPNVHAEILKDDEPPTPDWPKHYTTVEGDTIESVAEMFYGGL